MSEATSHGSQLKELSDRLSDIENSLQKAIPEAEEANKKVAEAETERTSILSEINRLVGGMSTNGATKSTGKRGRPAGSGKRGRPKKVVAVGDGTPKRRGRPRKEGSTATVEKKSSGRRGRPPKGEGTLKDMILQQLKLSKSGLTLEEVAKKILTAGYKPGGDKSKFGKSIYQYLYHLTKAKSAKRKDKKYFAA